ncbi:MAG: hypothetical protein LBT05_09660 [Planctomycetaceae bacterium]|jgi:hypothetical protein|nr:hypothetical protein [Planctomycetaceae bacterium]
MQEKNSEILTIDFGTEEHNVKAEAVAAMIQAITRLIYEANAEINGEQNRDDICVKVHAVAPGSLKVLLSIYGLLLFENVPLLFENAPKISALLSICKDYLSVKKWLKGKPLPEKQADGTYKINEQTININNVKTVNIINNSYVNEKFDEAFQETNKDTSVKEVTFSKEKEKLIQIPKDDFQYFEIKPDHTKQENNKDRKEKNERHEVTIHTPVLSGKAKWTVVFQEQQIKVTIIDKDFIEKVASTLVRFGAGDKLDVDILTISNLDISTGEYIIDPKEYKVTKVWKTIHKKINLKDKDNDSHDEQQKRLF